MLLYALTVLVSAFLLFQIEPIIAKAILPWFGGSANVWTTCLLFFQIVLLLGYLYAHAVVRYLRTKAQVVLHIGLLAASLLALPVVPGAAYLSALLNWHPRHGFCENCGAATIVAEAGYSRRCPQCGVTHFPRTDPVVIMLVEHAGRLLLGRRAGWPGNRYSVLAGFVSPGESLEEAVVREVREESGIQAYDPRFVTSQPWPFPASLMLGFDARSDGGEPRALDGELEDVQWFTRSEEHTSEL